MSAAPTLSRVDYQAVFESLPGLYLVLSPDAPRFTILAVSERYAQATRVRVQDAVGKGLFEVFADNPHDPRANGAHNLRASLERVLATREADAMAVQKYDVRLTGPEGVTFEDRWWSPVNSPVLDTEGRVVYLIHRVKDVTDYMRLIHRDAERGRTATDLREQAQRMESEIFLRAQQLQETNERLRAAYEEVARLYDKTLKLDRLKSEFFAAVSHELRTPLTLILGPAEAMLGRGELDADARRGLEVIQRNARTLLQHVNDLLDAARLEAGRLTLDYTQTDLVRLARFVCSHFEGLAHSRHIDLRVDTPSSLPAAVDAARMSHVLMNLLSNAFKFSPSGSTVRVSVSRLPGLGRIEVADSGPGIDEAQRGEVFEPFSRAAHPAPDGSAGAGLGLAIARDVIALHHGRIEVGDAPEGGALFVFTVPLQAPAGVPVASGPPQVIEDRVQGEVRHRVQVLQGAPVHAPMPHAASAPLVLVVEDHADMNRFVCDSLAGMCRLATASDGRQGCELARALQPQLIVTDLMMPGMSGDQLVHELRRHRELDDTAILVLSAKADDALRVRMLREGAQDYVIKPFVAEELRARVGALLAARAAHQALREQEEQLREVFDHASDGIIVADVDGRYVRVNAAACRLLGYAEHEILGKTTLDLIEPEDISRLRRSREVQDEGDTHVEEWRLRRKDGSFVSVEVRAKVLSDGRRIGLARDISEHKRLLASQQAMAEELEGMVQRRTEQLRQLGADLEAAEDRERRKVAHDLHDDLGQILAAARIWLGSLLTHPDDTVKAMAGEAGALIDKANRATRSLAAQLAPAMLYELGLVPALEWLGQDMEHSFMLQVEIDDDGQPKPLSHNARSILYRATRELLINAAKHARTHAAAVKIRREGQSVVVRVSDAGVGFDATALTGDRPRGLGLLSVRERLSFIGGTVELNSVPGDGTVAVLRAPLDEGASASQLGDLSPGR